MIVRLTLRAGRRENIPLLGPRSSVRAKSLRPRFCPRHATNGSGEHETTPVRVDSDSLFARRWGRFCRYFCFAEICKTFRASFYLTDSGNRVSGQVGRTRWCSDRLSRDSASEFSELNDRSLCRSSRNLPADALSGLGMIVKIVHF